MHLSNADGEREGGLWVWGALVGLWWLGGPSRAYKFMQGYIYFLPALIVV